MIFESPDGGKTVYRRNSFDQTRELYSVTEEKRLELERQTQWVKWYNILQAAETNPAIKQALDRAQVIYELSRHEI